MENLDVMAGFKPAPTDEIINTQTGESMPRYANASIRPFTKEQIAILSRRLDDSEIMIDPNGAIYLPQIGYRNTLNAAFGPGAWAFIPQMSLVIKGQHMMREYALYVEGRFISEALGAQEYRENNPYMTYADCAEGAKSDALKKACKDIGIAAQCWDKSFAETWKAKYAMQVWLKSDMGKPKPQWRLKSAAPLRGETGIVSQKTFPLENVKSESIGKELPPPVTTGYYEPVRTNQPVPKKITRGNMPEVIQPEELTFYDDHAVHISPGIPLSMITREPGNEAEPVGAGLKPAPTPLPPPLRPVLPELPKAEDFNENREPGDEGGFVGAGVTPAPTRGIYYGTVGFIAQPDGNNITHVSMRGEDKKTVTVFTVPSEKIKKQLWSAKKQDLKVEMDFDLKTMDISDVRPAEGNDG